MAQRKVKKQQKMEHVKIDGDGFTSQRKTTQMEKNESRMLHG